MVSSPLPAAQSSWVWASLLAFMSASARLHASSSAMSADVRLTVMVAAETGVAEREKISSENKLRTNIRGGGGEI